MTPDTLHAVEYSVISSAVISAAICEFFRRRIAKRTTIQVSEGQKTPLASVEDLRSTLEQRRMAQSVKSELPATPGSSLVSIDNLSSAIEVTSVTSKPSAILAVRRANVVRKMYSRLVTAERAWAELLNPTTTPGSPAADRAERHALAVTGEFHDRFLNDRIYFPRHVVKAMSEVDMLITDVARIYGIHGSRASQYDRDRLYGAWTNVTARLPAIREELEAQFMELLNGTA